MKLGLFYEWPNPQTSDWKRLFEESIEQIQLGEELGFDFVLIAEHHFSNYGMTPAPLLEALAIGKATKRIKIATAVLVLPEWQPLRLAEEIAVVDNLLDGRFICGIGRGYQPFEFARFGVTTEDSRDRFSEALEVLMLAWSQDTSFTYDGEYVKIPNETVVWPKPLQQPHPPIWLAGTSQDTLRLAAERDFAPLIAGFAGNDTVRDAVVELLRQREIAGRPADRWELGVQTFCGCYDSNEEARASMKYAQWQIRALRALNRHDVVDGRVQTGAYEGEPDDDGYWERLHYGDPQRLLEKYLSLADAGATFASCWMMHGGVEHKKLMRSIELVGKHVLPAVHEAKPSPQLTARGAK